MNPSFIHVTYIHENIVIHTMKVETHCLVNLIFHLWTHTVGQDIKSIVIAQIHILKIQS